MKQVIATAAWLFTCVTGDAMAACAGTRIGDVTGLEDGLKNRLVCGQATSGSDKWQEEFRTGSGGVLWERAKGVGHPVDPSHAVGSWSVSGANPNAVVCSEYSHGTYCHRLFHISGDDYRFCSDDTAETEVATATLYPMTAPIAQCGF